MEGEARPTARPHVTDFLPRAQPAAQPPAPEPPRPPHEPIVTVPVDGQGRDPLVHRYVQRFTATCAYRTISWAWVGLGAVAAVIGALVGNRFGAVPAAPPDLTPFVLWLHAQLGNTAGGMAGIAVAAAVVAALGALLHRRGVSPAQEVWGGAIAVALLYQGFYDSLILISVLTALICAVYIAAIVFRIAALVLGGGRQGLRSDRLEPPAGGWPVYTVLVPLYRERNVAGSILASLEKLDYPREKLDVKFLLEADDPETLDALKAAGIPWWAEVVVVPPGQPKTKPRACNHGLERARGEFLVIYDAEDHPAPDQLKQAVIAFDGCGDEPVREASTRRLGGLLLCLVGAALTTWMVSTIIVRGSLLGVSLYLPQGVDEAVPVALFAIKCAVVTAVLLAPLIPGIVLWQSGLRRGPVACLQAHLAYHNHDQNLLTRWFALEYNVWFRRYLSGLELLAVPIPLGGTSNHFRTGPLRELGGWDPFNVTEDCDLGMRLRIAGWRTRILDSVTWEEANSRVGNWVRQRSRWLKGYLVTHLVWFRRPLRLLWTMGPYGVFGFLLSVVCVSALSALNLVVWTLTALYATLLTIDVSRGHDLWLLLTTREEFYAHDRLSWPMAFLGRGEDPFWSALSFSFFLVSCCLVLGNLAFVFINMVAGRRPGQKGLWWAALISPLYWVLIAVAAWKGVWQLLVRPHYWEKTVHGLDGGHAQAGPAERKQVG